MIFTRRAMAGFTLIELMIVVAIVSLLASIAVPTYTNMRLRAKRSELPVNLDSIRSAEKAYEAEWDAFTSCAAAPATIPTKAPVDFGRFPGDQSDWDLLGWMPDGKIRGQYSVAAQHASNIASLDFSAVARSDLDGDGRAALYIADRDTKPTILSSDGRY